MKVRATRLGYYGDKRRREGEVFDISSPSELGKWMEPVDGMPKEVKKAPVEEVKKPSTAKEVI